MQADSQRDDCRSRSQWRAFGFEWRRWSRFGLEGGAEAAGLDTTRVRDAYREHLLAHTIATFPRKTLLKADDICGRRVLDAGCGNGRYSVAAAMAGASEVLAIDPSESAEVAAENLREYANAHARRLAIDQLDESVGRFDAAFSIGVLQHLADPAAAVAKLADRLAPGGVLTVHVYRRRNAISRAITWPTRQMTSRLPHGALWAWCVLPTATGRLTMVSKYLHAAVNCVCVCYPTMHQNFDWYAPRLARQYEPADVRGWFEQAGLEAIEDDDPYARADSYYNRLYPAWMKRRNGTLQAWVRHFLGPMGLTVRGVKP